MSVVNERRIREQLIASGIIKPGPKFCLVPKAVIQARQREARLVNPATERAMAIFHACACRPMPAPLPKAKRGSRCGPQPVAVKKARDAKLREIDQRNRELGMAMAFADALLGALEVL
jgi:hypothetical protein